MSTVAARARQDRDGPEGHGEGREDREEVLALERWAGPVDAGDHALLDRCVGATIDLGCGPGRLAAELARRGHRVVGVDVCLPAAALTRERGVDVVLADLFGPLPGEGGWETALLADGNVGIGGDPARLLTRTALLLVPGGRVVLDLAPPGSPPRLRRVRVAVAGRGDGGFLWAAVAADAVPGLAGAAGLEVEAVSAEGTRWVAVLRRPGVGPCAN